MNYQELLENFWNLEKISGVRRFGNLKKKLFFILGTWHLCTKSERIVLGWARFFLRFPNRRHHHPLYFAHEVQNKKDERRRFANIQKYFSNSWHLWRKSERIV
jgi:hypothetical protein